MVLSTINGASPDGSLKYVFVLFRHNFSEVYTLHLVRYLAEKHFNVVVIDECAQVKST